MNRTHEKLKLIIAMAFVGSIGIFVQWMELPSAIIAFFRALMGAMVLFIWMKNRKIPIVSNQVVKHLPMLIFSGTMMAMNWIFLFEAFKWTSISVATICYYLAPAIIMIASPFFFKERLTWLQFLVIVLSLLGIFLISGGADESTKVNGRGVIYGVIAAILYAGVMISSKLVKTIDALIKTAVQFVIASLVMGIYCFMILNENLEGLSLMQWGLLLVVGIFHTGIAYVVIFQAFDRLPSQTASLITYMDPVASVFYTLIIFGQTLSLGQWLGAALVIGSSMIYESMTRKSKNVDLLE